MNTTHNTPEQRQRATEHVLLLFGWKMEAYTTMQYEEGVDYLIAYCGDMPELVRDMERSKLFWNWWKNQWSMRDEVYLSFMKIARLPQGLMRSIYYEMNAGYAIAKARVPHKQLLEDIIKELKTIE